MSKIQSILQNYLQALNNLDVVNQNEHTGRTPLENLLNSLKAEFDLGNIAITHEGKRDKDGNGAPDFTINDNQKSTVIGYIENKKIDENLSKILKSKQIEKYQKLSDNLILTDYLEWIWIYKDAEPVRARLCNSSDLENPKFKLDEQKVLEISNLIQNFYSKEPAKIATAKELAQKLARPSIEIKNYLTEQIDFQAKNEDQRDELYGVYEIFRDGLFEELDSKDFADGFAQMLTYSVFLAKLNSTGILSLNNVKNSIPEAFSLIKTLDKFLDLLSQDRHKQIKWAVENILSVINNIDTLAIAESLSSKYGDEEKDPYIYFYEDFLGEYDMEAKVDRGVYYTPPAVVQFIVNQVNNILEQDFELSEGLKNSEVKVLDFATGTGTFLFESYKKVLQNTQTGSFEHSQVIKHLLNNFYGFEIMISSYIIAHLKLSQFLKEKGFDITQKENHRIGVYLTNTLDNKQEFPINFLARAVSQEGKKAKEIKEDNQIIAIMGNPPYNVFSKNPLHETNPLKAFHQNYKPVDEKKLNMDDDYIKFIAFSHQKIQKSGKGIVAMIVNNSFLKGLTHRRMRNELLKDFDKIYVVDLHGNARIGETAPDGGADQNVFDIMQGVCIIILVKNPNIKDKGVYQIDLYGKRKPKLKALSELTIPKNSPLEGWQPKVDGVVSWQKLPIVEFNQNFRSTKWGKNRFKDDLSFFAPMNEAKAMIEYGEFWGLTEIFKQVSGGVKTDRDELVINFEKQRLEEKMKIAFSGNYDQTFLDEYNITNSSSYNFADKLKQGSFDENAIRKTDYRPFDSRFIYYKQGFTSRPAFETMQHMLKGGNVGLTFARNHYGQQDYDFIFVSENIIDIHLIGGQAYFTPLYLYEQPPENDVFENDGLTKKPNFTKEFQEFVNKKFGEVSPEVVLGFIYASMHSPVYRTKYLELLKIDFPRVNFEVSPQEFERLAKIGQELIEIHLMKKIPETKTEIDCFAPDFDNIVVEKVRYDEVNQRIYLSEPKNSPFPKRGGNEADGVLTPKSTYFEKVTSEVWNYKIGGYQVLDKYLKSRKDKILTHQEIQHFKNMVRVIEWTLKIIEITRI